MKLKMIVPLSLMVLASAAFAVVDQDSRPAFIHLTKTMLIVFAGKVKDKESQGKK